jgi:hypothetical protein
LLTGGMGYPINLLGSIVIYHLLVTNNNLLAIKLISNQRIEVNMKNPKIIFDINSFNLDNILNTVKKMKKDSKGLTVSKQKKLNKIKGGHGNVKDS